MANIYDMSDVWADGATTFTAVKMNVTDTASSASSLLMDLQVGGVSKFKVSKAGAVTLASISTTASDLSLVAQGSVGLKVGASQSIARLSFGIGDGNLSTDCTLFRDAANTLAQRNGTNAQTFNLYNTYTDGSNYERGFMKWVSNQLQVGVGNAGTGTARSFKMTAAGRVAEIVLGSTYNQIDFNSGAFVFSGSIVKMASLPTSNPAVAGQLWNDAGTLKISAG